MPANDIDISQPLITAMLGTKQLTEGDTATLTITATNIIKATSLRFTIEGALRSTNQQLSD